MNRHDRKAWASARSMADLGEGVVAWLNGDLTETPGHMGPPDDETIPLIFTLSLINRSGFVTDNSQRGGSNSEAAWDAWVSGFASPATMASLRKAVAGTDLILTACRGRVHQCGRELVPRLLRFLMPCPGRDARSSWADRSPHISGELADAWYATIADPGPDRNDRLWPALRDALTAEVTP